MKTTDSTAGAESGAPTEFDAVVVGAGFSGLYMLHQLRELGLSVRVYEKAADVGGTWYWNRYPGARCDSESHIYCYSFDEELLEEWEWSERYPEQPEVLEYLRHVADRFDLRRDISFGTEVTAARFDGDAGRWELTTDGGERVSTQFLITAVGTISEPYVPEFEGVETFEGEYHHTGRWPHDGVEFAGKRVAVIGTGASGIQVVPEIVDDVQGLTVYQRTPNYAVPARNRPLDSEEYREIKSDYDEIWEAAHDSGFGMPFEPGYPTAEGLSDEEVTAALEERWQQGGFRFMLTFEDLLFNETTNRKVSEFIRGKIRDTVDDPELAETLCPTDHPYATKRPPLHTDYYETYNEPHVDLVDVTETPIERFTPEGIRTTDGHRAFDTVVMATGFDGVTGALLAMDVEGRDGLAIDEKWADGPETYLGLSVHGFPNVFTITGPQSPSVLSNMPVSIEHHVEWIADCVEYMTERDIGLIEPTRAAEREWVAHSRAVADQTLYPQADSWYMNQNIPGKPTVFLPYVGGVDVYRGTLAEAAEKGYEGFELTGSVEELGREGSQPSLGVIEGD